MSKEKRLSQEPGWVKDYNNAAVSAGRGKQINFPNQTVKRILERGPFTKEDMLAAWQEGQNFSTDMTFQEWFDQYINKKMK